MGQVSPAVAATSVVNGVSRPLPISSGFLSVIFSLEKCAQNYGIVFAGGCGVGGRIAQARSGELKMKTLPQIVFPHLGIF